ncbi:triphosphoribosyl-dephospho-CoA synthase CitG [Arsenicicoccus dermatophilus]|uniref:triphosphoribosyl-dephospho-CoA synthase CitG n=1 Tax=Arsenicicoccus dermatophilus TaxID=1076331 RepID=UPI003917154A
MAVPEPEPRALPTAHPRPETVLALHDHAHTAHLSRLARRALLAEVELTPKPGLVDARTTGAHQDMDITTFRASVAAIAPWFPVLHETGRAGHRDGPDSFLTRLRGPGIACEEAMFTATGGVNTHKGAVFAFGLLLGCAGRLSAGGHPVTVPTLCHLVARMTTGLVTRELAPVERPGTYGERAYVDHGLTGARGQAAGGYRTVTDLALPAYRLVEQRTGDRDLALTQALLVLMATTDDTTLVKDGHLGGLRHVQAGARAILETGGALDPGVRDRMSVLDAELSERGLSPGGCADLLAVTAFLAELPSA